MKTKEQKEKDRAWSHSPAGLTSRKRYRESRKGKARRRHWLVKRKEDPKIRKKYLRYLKKWRIENREVRLKKAAIVRYELKQTAIYHYGNACSDCGNFDLRVLSLHHINGDGVKHRRKLKMKNPRSAGSEFYRRLIESGFEGPSMVVLCANCHMSRHSGHPASPQSNPPINPPQVPHALIFNQIVGTEAVSLITRKNDGVVGVLNIQEATLGEAVGFLYILLLLREDKASPPAPHF